MTNTAVAVKAESKAAPAGGLDVMVLQENLVAGLAAVVPASPRRAVLPLLGNVHLSTDRGRLRLQATDLDVAVATWVGARIDGAGEAVVPARLALRMARSLGPVTVRLKGRSVTTEREEYQGADSPRAKVTRVYRHVDWFAKGVSYSLEGLDAADWPKVTTSTDGDDFSLDVAELSQALEWVSPSAATDDSRPVLTGACFAAKGENIEMASADGFRLSMASVKRLGAVDSEMRVIVPWAALQHVRRLMKGCLKGCGDAVSVRVSESRTMATFAHGDWEVTAHLIQGTYPGYVKLLPETWSTRMALPAAAWRTAAKRTSFIAEHGSGIVRLELDGSSGLLVWAYAEAIGESRTRLLAAVTGEANKIAVNARYLTDALAGIEGDVSFEMSTPSHQCVFRDEGRPGWLHMIMPMFVQWDEKVKSEWPTDAEPARGRGGEGASSVPAEAAE
jgi:DNA polymerase-3 subunit beta